MATEQNLALFRNLVAVAYADGQLQTAERRLLDKYATQLGILPEEVEALLQSAPQEGLRIQLPADLPGRLSFFKQAAEIVHADGVLTEPEERLLETLRSKMEIPPEMMADLLHRFDTGTTRRPPKPPVPLPGPEASIVPPIARPQQRSRVPWVLGVLLVVGVAALVVGVLVFRGLRSVNKAPFEPYLADYTKAVVFPEEVASDPDEEPVAPEPPALVGKVVVIDRKEREVDDLHFDLPETLRAKEPEEVGTVVWVEWGQIQEGSYTDGSAAYIQTCVVTVIDREKWEVLGRNTFQGASPPSFKKGGGSRTGSKPTKEIVQYLSSLPR